MSPEIILKKNNNDDDYSLTVTFTTQCHQNTFNRVQVLTNLIRKQKTDGVDLAWSWRREVKTRGSEDLYLGSLIC